MDGEFNDIWIGALVLGDELALDDMGHPEAVAFTIAPDSGDTEGGEGIAISASAEVILPGTRVVLRARNSATEIYTGRSPFDESSGEETIKLFDNVLSLDQFTFVLPGVIEPDLYDLFFAHPQWQQRT